MSKRVTGSKAYGITRSKHSYPNEGAFGSLAIDSVAILSTPLEQVEEKYSNVEEWTRKLRKKYLHERYFARVLGGSGR